MKLHENDTGFHEVSYDGKNEYRIMNIEDRMPTDHVFSVTQYPVVLRFAAENLTPET
jgi:hypothetical protein